MKIFPSLRWGRQILCIAALAACALVQSGVGLGLTGCGTSSPATAPDEPISPLEYCDSERGCPVSEVLPVCVDEAVVIPVAVALNAAETDAGQAVAVEGILEKNFDNCTMKRCEPGTCCNECWADVRIRSHSPSGEMLYLDRTNTAFVCSGNESRVCCGTELGMGRVRLIGNVRDTAAGRRLDVREACRVDETLLTSAGKGCIKANGCEPATASAGVCTRRKDELSATHMFDAHKRFLGKKIHLKGRIAKGDTMCTEMACAEGTCCNTCGSRMRLLDDRGRYVELVSATPTPDGKPDPFVCAGDDSWVCCPTFAENQLGVVSGTFVEEGGRFLLKVDAICDL